MKNIIICTVFIFLSGPLYASSIENLLAVSQGISSPSITSNINYSNGYTKENPSGVAYQDAYRLSLQFDTGDNDDNSNTPDVDGTGVEAGVGNGSYGLAVGYYDRDCNGCDSTVAGALGAFFGNFGLGIRFEEEIYSMGFLINPKGTHRIGLAADLNDPSGNDNNITSYGLGYSYVNPNFTFSVDASKRDYENSSVNDDVILVSPGLSVRVKMIGLTVTHDSYMNEPDNSNLDDETWWGVGVGEGSQWHVAIYNDFVNQWTFVGSLFF
ncbi:MAG: hypothetical protein KDD34_04540 [Bdellovibrionales bacterium]|nr:hypothetical protein [Bdellovibrionales bacterium]